MTAAELAETIARNLENATPEIIEGIKRADIGDDAKLAMLYFADPEFRASIQDITAQALAKAHA